MFCSIYFFKSCRLRENMGKYCRDGEATEENTVRAPFMLDTKGYEHFHCNSGCTNVPHCLLIRT